MDKPDECAFPREAGAPEKGLTKREYIAAQCLAGLMAAPCNPYCPPTIDYVAQQAVMWADALLDALTNPPKEKK